MPHAEELQGLARLTIKQLAALIKADWKKPYYGAKPYLEAMEHLSHINDRYGADDGQMIVLYFLSNAATWRGETAKAVKAELKRRTN